MPTVSSGKVLITGANGYVAVWLTKLLLEAGYSVRGTVRSNSKATYLHTLFKPFGSRFETVIVPDIEKPDAFSPYVADVAAIVHTATPVHMTASDPDSIIRPAVDGTLSVLRAAHEHSGPALKRVIVISSAAALAVLEQGPLELNESTWNDAAVAQVHELGRRTPGPVLYMASKTLAERAAWDWYAQHKGTIGWDLTVLVPPYVLGAPLHDVDDDPMKLNESLRVWWENVNVLKRDNENLVTETLWWVHVLDLVQAHILALQTPAAGGERIVVSAGQSKWQDFVNAARPLSEKIPPGNTAYDPAQAHFPLNVNNNKSKNLLGITYRTSLRDLTKELVDDCKSRGWL